MRIVDNEAQRGEEKNTGKDDAEMRLCLSVFPEFESLERHALPVYSPRYFAIVLCLLLIACSSAFIMAAQWEERKEDIRQLYLVQRLSLTQTMEVMKERGFDKSRRSYKYYLKHWHFHKTKRGGVGNNASPGPSNNQAVADTRDLSDNDAVISSASEASSFEYAQANQLAFLASSTVGSYPLLSVAHSPDGSEAVGDLAAFDPGYVDLFFSPQANSGHRSLHNAVLHGQEDEVKMLLSQGAAIDVGDSAGNLPLHYALHHQDDKIIKLLLGYYEDHTGPMVKPEQVSFTLCHQNADGDTPLHSVISAETLNHEHTGSFPTLLLRAGANPHIPNKLGITPIHKAVDLTSPTMSWNHERHIDKMLMARSTGLTPEKTTSLFTLFLAKSGSAWIEAESPPNALFKDFLASGADADTPTGSGSRRLLTYFLDFCYKTRQTSKNCDLQLATAICQKLDVTRVSIKGDSCLHELIRFVGAWSYSPSISELIEVVVKRHADVNHLNADRKTPLMLLMEKRQLVDETHTVLLLLLEHGANPWVPDAKEDFPMYAAVRNNPEMGSRLAKTILLAEYPLDLMIACQDTWWQAWMHALILENWDTATQVLEHASHSLPLDVKAPIYRLALAVLAEKYIHREVDRYLSSNRSPRDRGRHLMIVGNILTKSYEFDVDPRWFHYLLVFTFQTSSGGDDTLF